MASLLAFRDRWAGTVQDICAGVTIIAFMAVVAFWLSVLA